MLRYRLLILAVIALATIAPLGQAQLIFYDGFTPGVDYAVVEVSGTVVLPPGVAVDPTDLTVETLAGATSPDSAGNFSLTTFAERHLAIVNSPTGAPMLMGLIGVGDNQLSARSTAIFCLFFALGGSTVPSELHLGLLELLGEEAAVADLEDVIATQLAANTDAFYSTNAAVKEALDDAIAAIRSNAKFAAATKDVTPLPETDQSGITFDKKFQAFALTNSYKRPLRAYADLERCSGPDGVVDAGSSGCQLPSPPPEFDVKAVAGARSVTDLVVNAGTIIFGWTEGNDIALIPIQSETAGLPVPDDFDSATYTIYTIGPGAGEGVIEELTAMRRDALSSLATRFLILDLVIPTITQVAMPAFGERLDRIIGRDTMTSLIADVTNAMSNRAKDALDGGDTQGAFEIVLSDIVNNNGTLREVLLSAIHSAILSRYSLEEAAEFWDGGTDFLRALGVVDAVLAGFDSAVTGAQLLASDRAVRWTALVTQPDIAITPTVAEVKCGQPVEFTANIRDLNDTTDVTFAYKWSIDPEAGTLVDCRGREGSSLTTSCETVSLKANFVRDLFDLKVEVEANPSGGARFDAGSDTAVADIQLPDVRVQLTPWASTLDNGDSQNLNVVLRPLSSSEGCASADLSTRWTNTAEFGQIDVPEGEETRRQSVSYRANPGNKHGSDDVEVDVLYQRNGGPFTNLGSGRAVVRVEDEPTIIDGELDIRTSFFVDMSGVDRQCTAAAIVVPSYPDESINTRYELIARGGYDILSGGEGPETPQIRRTAPPFTDETNDPFFIPFPPGSRVMGLSAVCGPDETAGENFDLMQTRFGSLWEWKIFVTP